MTGYGMHNVATLAEQAIHQAQAAPHQDTLQVSAVIRKLFMVLHGSYGNAFIGKFSTGEKDSKGHDKGIRAAMKVWDAKLSKYTPDVVETAADRVGEAHAEFPPSLPQFEKLCEAAMPRQTYAQEQGLVALPAPKQERVHVDVKHRNDGKDWARLILARISNGDTSVSRYSKESAEMALGQRAKMS